MPRANFGEPITPEKTSATYFQLKSKGDKIIFRLLGGGAYDAKHFDDQGDRIVAFDCPRLMSEDGSVPCEECQVYFDLGKALKQEKDLLTAKEIREREKARDAHKPKMTFYYPVVNRATHAAVIFRTSFMVRKALETEVANGIKVLDFDYVVERTEEPSKYYTLTRLPDKDCKPLTQEEQESATDLLSVDILDRVTAKRSSMDMGESTDDQREEEPDQSKMKDEEKVDPSDIPF